MKNLVLQIALGVFLGTLGALSVVELWHTYHSVATSSVTPDEAEGQAGPGPGAPQARQNTAPQQLPEQSDSNAKSNNADEPDDDGQDEGPDSMDEDLDDDGEDPSNAQ